MKIRLGYDIHFETVAEIAQVKLLQIDQPTVSHVNLKFAT